VRHDATNLTKVLRERAAPTGKVCRCWMASSRSAARCFAVSSSRHTRPRSFSRLSPSLALIFYTAGAQADHREPEPSGKVQVRSPLKVNLLPLRVCSHKPLQNSLLKLTLLNVLSLSISLTMYDFLSINVYIPLVPRFERRNAPCGSHDRHVGGVEMLAASTAIVPINRKKPFDPVLSLDKGWAIVEEDKRSLALSEVDITKIRLKTFLMTGEHKLIGEEKIRRLKQTAYIRLDANVCLTFSYDPQFIPNDWKGNIDDTVKFVFFDGTILLDPDGHRCVLCLYWDINEWRLYPRRLDLFWDAGRPSAVLAS
jgi:hypothetical protein